MDKRRTRRFKAILEARRTTLFRAHVRNVHDEDVLLSEREPDVLDSGAERAAAAVLERLAASELREVFRIDAALARIEAGTWGTCRDCGIGIGTDRLDVMPEAARCIECESGAGLAA